MQTGRLIENAGMLNRDADCDDHYGQNNETDPLTPGMKFIEKKADGTANVAGAFSASSLVPNVRVTC